MRRIGRWSGGVRTGLCQWQILRERIGGRTGGALPDANNPGLPDPQGPSGAAVGQGEPSRRCRSGADGRRRGGGKANLPELAEPSWSVPFAGQSVPEVDFLSSSVQHPVTPSGRDGTVAQLAPRRPVAQRRSPSRIAAPRARFARGARSTSGSTGSREDREAVRESSVRSAEAANPPGPDLRGGRAEPGTANMELRAVEVTSGKADDAEPVNATSPGDLARDAARDARLAPRERGDCHGDGRVASGCAIGSRPMGDGSQALVPAPPQRQAMEAGQCRSPGAQRDPAGFEACWPGAPAQLERLSAAQQSRDMSRIGKRSVRHVPRRLDELREVAWPADDVCSASASDRRQRDASPSTHRLPGSRSGWRHSTASRPPTSRSSWLRDKRARGKSNCGRHLICATAPSGDFFGGSSSQCIATRRMDVYGADTGVGPATG